MTICTQGRECLFGDCADGVVQLNPVGAIVRSVWDDLSKRYSHVVTNEFVIMPNHFHGIIYLVGAPLAAPDVDFKYEFGHKNKGAASSVEIQGAASSTPTLGSIMRVFKSLSAIDVNKVLDRQGRPLWQRNYYERVIRDEKELTGIREYIQQNPVKWADDVNNPNAT